jgi:hypothetical protein
VKREAGFVSGRADESVRGGESKKRKVKSEKPEFKMKQFLNSAL